MEGMSSETLAVFIGLGFMVIGGFWTVTIWLLRKIDQESGDIRTMLRDYQTKEAASASENALRAIIVTQDREIEKIRPVVHGLASNVSAVSLKLDMLNDRLDQLEASRTATEKAHHEENQETLTALLDTLKRIEQRSGQLLIERPRRNHGQGED